MEQGAGIRIPEHVIQPLEFGLQPSDETRKMAGEDQN